MGTWTTTAQTVESWSAPIRTETGHAYKGSSYSWYHFIRFSIGRRVSDKAVIIRAELYGGKESGWTDQSGSWSFGAKRSSEASLTEATYSKTLKSSSWDLHASYYYVDNKLGSATYNVSFYKRNGETGAWEEHTLSIDSAGAARANVSGTWKEAQPFVKIGGEWKEAQPFAKVNGAWKESI